MSAERVHTLHIRAMPEDIDELDHVSNIAYVRWVQNVAKSHSTLAGWDDAAYRRLGSVFVVRRHEIDYLRPALLGDDIALETWVESWRAASSVRKTLIRRADGTELARCATQWAFVSLANGRPQRIPDDLRAAFTVE